MSATPRDVFHAARLEVRGAPGAGAAMRRGAWLRWVRRAEIAVPILVVTVSAATYTAGTRPDEGVDRIRPPVQSPEPRRTFAPSTTPSRHRSGAALQGLPGGTGRPLRTPGTERPVTVVPRGLTGQLSFTVTTHAPVLSTSRTSEIHVLDLASGRVARVTPSGLNAAIPTLSRDGSWIAYSAQFGTLREPLHLIRPDGTDDRKVFAPPDGAALAPTWSPDGRQIAFRYEPTTDNARTPGHQLNSSIWVVDADGTNPRRIEAITSNMDPDHPAWSPDGRRLAFWHRTTNTVHVLDLETGTIELVASGGHPEWSPDGRHLAVAQDSKIVVVDTGGRGIVNTIDWWGTAETPTWSPDGKWIAFAALRGTKRAIYVVRSFGQSPQVLIENPYDNWSPSWGPAPRP